jgi:hypothetical protein
VNPSASQPSNPRTLMGCRGIFRPYPFLPVGDFGPLFHRAHPPRGRARAWRAHSSRWDGAKRRGGRGHYGGRGSRGGDSPFIALPITGALGPSAVAAPIPSFRLLHLPPPKPKPFPICALVRALEPLPPPSNGVVVPFGRGSGASGRSCQARASLPVVHCRGMALTWK